MTKAGIVIHMETINNRFPPPLPSEGGFFSKVASAKHNVETNKSSELNKLNRKQKGEQSNCSSFLLVTVVAVLRYLRLNKYALMGCMYSMMISAYVPDFIFAQSSFGCEGQGKGSEISCIQFNGI
jgi:hypothetical protein